VQEPPKAVAVTVGRRPPPTNSARTTSTWRERGSLAGAWDAAGLARCTAQAWPGPATLGRWGAGPEKKAGDQPGGGERGTRRAPAALRSGGSPGTAIHGESERGAGAAAAEGALWRVPRNVGSLGSGPDDEWQLGGKRRAEWSPAKSELVARGMARLGKSLEAFGRVQFLS
jgi:hypothetical protein